MKMKRVLSLLLALVMTFSLLTLPSYAEDEKAATLTVTMDGKAVDAVTLPQGGKVELKAQADAQVSDYCWQINIGKEMWVDISGETGSTIQVSYAMVASLLSDNKVALRCKTDAGVSNAVTVTVTAPKVEHQAATFSVPRANAALMAAPANGAGETPSTYNVVINYVFENNQIVADPYTANLAAGSSFSATVTFPTVQGYLPYVGESQQNSIDLNYTAINQNYTYNVVYKPTNVNYTVIHYQQNLDNDKYTEVDRETKRGLTNSTVPEVAKTYYEGFYALLYEKPTIAADGSTVVEVYYDRYYYLMNFNLDGGYGVEPIYARFGAPIGDVGTPTKAGYSFSGWSLDGSPVSALPSTMPAENRTYKAVWEADNTAKVTVVFWGENADDEEYSYIRSMQVDATPGASYSYDGSTLTCPLAEHSHGTSKCTLNCTHVHTLDCYSTYYDDFVETTKPTTNLTNKGNGIYTYTTTGRFGSTTTHYYLNIGDKWYCGTNWRGNKDDTQSINYSCKHTHTDACYSCGLTGHTHGSACSGLWTFGKSDTVTVAADGSTVVNVYYDRTTFTLTFRANNKTVAKITDKWGADIHTKFPIVGTNGTTYKGTEWKVPDRCQTFTAGTNVLSIDTMPSENITFSSDNTNASATLYYYVESLDGTGTHYNGKYYDLYKTVYLPYSGRLTESEEFHEIIGFTKGDYYPSTIFNSVSREMYLYYTRNSFDIVFYNPTELIHTEENVPYQKNLRSYVYTPTPNQAPAMYEPGSVEFEGWYLNPECSGQKFDFSSHTMPAGPTNTNGEVALSLYAKWVPVSHTVEFYLDKAAYENEQTLESHPVRNVPHGSKVTDVANPTNGSYTFVGWFYMENGVEKAFEFANMPVTKDMQVYGKWSSNVLKQYTIYYKIQDTDTEIAAPTTGSTLAGVTKTFEAKGGTDLYANYQEGYFPVTKSHSLTLDINATEENDTNVYTFWYVQKEAVPYTVKYLNKETGASVAAEKTVSDNRKAVVTENFVPVSGMLPDAYQKRLVVSVKEDGNPDTEHNVIIFYYTEDTTHAYYKITHYTENLGTDAEGNRTWTEYASSQAVGDIRETYNAYPMTIPGFTYDSSVAGTVTSGKLTADGLELKLYYTRISYPYQVRYLEQGTGKQLADPKDGTAKYGQVVSESAIDIANYTAVDPTSQTLNIRIEESSTEAKLNIITFYYTEKEVTINYQVVGPTGASNFGSVSPTSETLKVLSGTALGSTATANENFRFVGWYRDEACTQAVTSSDGTLAGTEFIPAKAEGAVWVDGTTYYAKFEYDVADLTITKKAAAGTTIDDGQSFIFHVTGETGTNTADVNMYVTVQGAGSVIVKGLKVGDYTVTEMTSWSWRYTPDAEGGAKDVTVNGGVENTVTFTNTRNNNKWLSGDSYAINYVGGIKASGTFVSGN